MVPGSTAFTVHFQSLYINAICYAIKKYTFHCNLVPRQDEARTTVYGGRFLLVHSHLYSTGFRLGTCIKFNVLFAACPKYQLYGFACVSKSILPHTVWSQLYHGLGLNFNRGYITKISLFHAKKNITQFWLTDLYKDRNLLKGDLLTSNRSTLEHHNCKVDELRPITNSRAKQRPQHHHYWKSQCLNEKNISINSINRLWNS